MPAFVQTFTGASGVATGTATTSSVTSTSGNFVCVVAAAGNATLNRLSSVTDSNGNVYARAISKTSTSDDLEVWYCANIIGGAGHTVTATSSSGTDNVEVVAQEFSGVASTVPKDASITTSGTGTTLATQSTSVQQMSELIIGAVLVESNSASSTLTAGSGYTNVGNSGTGIAALEIYIESQVTSVGGSFAGTATLSVSKNYAIAMVSFRGTDPHVKFNNSGLRPHPFSPGVVR